MTPPEKARDHAPVSGGMVKRLSLGAVVLLFLFLLITVVQQARSTNAELAEVTRDRDAARAQIADLQRQVSELNDTVDSLTKQLKDAGITPDEPGEAAPQRRSAPHDAAPAPEPRPERTSRPPARSAPPPTSQTPTPGPVCVLIICVGS